MNHGIYRLIARNKDTNEIKQIKIKQLKEEQELFSVNVSSIDKLTTYFENEQQLIKRLYDNKYIDFLNADLYIEYKFNDRPHFIEVLYKEDTYFRNFMMESEAKISVKDPLFKSICNKILDKLIDEDTYYSLKKNNSVNKRIIEAIDEYLDAKVAANREFSYKIILRYLSSYKVLRDIHVFLKHYNDYDYYDSLDEKNEERIKCDYEFKKKKSKLKLHPITENIVNKEINIPDEIKEEKEETHIYDFMDLDDVIYSNDDELLEKYGIDKKAMDEYIKRR